MGHNRAHLITESLPVQWQVSDEWYSFESSIRVQVSEVLLTVDEAPEAHDYVCIVGGVNR